MAWIYTIPGSNKSIFLDIDFRRVLQELFSLLIPFFYSRNWRKRISFLRVLWLHINFFLSLIFFIDRDFFSEWHCRVRCLSASNNCRPPTPEGKSEASLKLLSRKASLVIKFHDKILLASKILEFFVYFYRQKLFRSKVTHFPNWPWPKLWLVP